MSITFACEQCGKSFTIEDKFAGKKGRCKQCGAVMDIPGVQSARKIPSSVDREVSPSRRHLTPAPSNVSAEDRYDLAEAASPVNAALPPGIEEVEPGRPFGTRSNPRAPNLYGPPKKKKSKGGGVLKTIGKVALIGVGVLAGLVAAAVGLRSVATSLIPGLSSKGEVEAILQERVAMNEQLAALLAGVNDAQSAETMSPQVIQKLQGITANLRKLKTTKVLKPDLEALRLKYQAPQLKATQQVINQFTRIGKIPGAGEALKVETALAELDVEERGVPGINQNNLTPTPDPGPSSATPVIHPAPSRGNQPPPGGPPRPGNRRGKGRPSPGAAPGSGGPV